MLQQYSCMVLGSDKDPVKEGKVWLIEALKNCRYDKEQQVKDFRVEVLNRESEAVPTTVLFVYGGKNSGARRKVGSRKK